MQERGEGGGGGDDGTIGTIITDYTAYPVPSPAAVIWSQVKDRVFTIPSPASRACDADSCDHVGVFGGKMTPLFIVSTAEYEPSLLIFLYGCVTKV